MFFEKGYVSFENDDDAITLADTNSILPIIVKEGEHKRVHRVAKDLQKDLGKVTGQKPSLINKIPTSSAVIIATLDHKDFIQQFGLDTSELEGKWESFFLETVKYPETDEEYIIIVGSDTRGAIYGVYDLAEKLGVSPWYWWMDVPIELHKEIYIKRGRYLQGEPSVEYRGFFLNDEGPALMTWVRTHFPDFTHEFYEKIFELTLRLKGNYHWPAMWDSTFYEDDEKSIVKADEYGVVIGTSHHEPMNRPHGDWKAHKKGPWDYEKNEEYLQEFWTEGIERSEPYETIINLGMRGDGDMPMGGNLTFEEKIALMEKIIKDQREIIQDVMDDASIEDVPQMWALYKEVKEYYDAGMNVPEDITLLWGDDNWGNIRRLPTKKERERKGGAGIYYHFDYVGGPRSYKWVNTVPIQKTWEQMHKAYEYDARKVWIVNVGDLKPMEFQTEFFMRLAWDIEAFNKDNLWRYTVEWAAYTFGEKYAERVAKVIHDYVKYNGRLKPELLNAVDLYSWESYFEAERVLEEFKETVNLSEELLKELPESLKDAFYQVGYYPTRASYVVLRLQLMCNLSKKYAEKGVRVANVAALEARQLFEEDKTLTFDYNKRIANGKWDHMMDQLHIGYTYWNQPEELVMPEVQFVDEENLVDGTWTAEIINSKKTDCYSKQPIVIDVYNKRKKKIHLSVAKANEWFEVSQESFDLNTIQRLFINVDWDNIPFREEHHFEVYLQDESGKTETLIFTVLNPEENISKGFLPINGAIAIEAEDYSRKQETNQHSWHVIPDYGRTQSTMAIYPVEFQEDYTLSEYPSLEYDIYVDNAGDIEVCVLTAPSLPFDPNQDLRLGISIDDREIQEVSPGDLSQNGKKDSASWQQSVIYNIHEFKKSFKDVEKGNHTVKLTLIDPQIPIQKIVIDLGGLKPSFLGPILSPHANELENYNPYEPKNKEDFFILPGELTNVLTSSSVFIEEAGWYVFDSEYDQVVLEAIDGQQIKSNTNTEISAYYLPEGFHQLQFAERIERLVASLVKANSFHIHQSVRFEKNKIENENIIQLASHNRGHLAQFYTIKAELMANDKILHSFGTKGTLKTDEQQLHTQSFLTTEKNDIVNLKLTIATDGWTRSEMFVFSLEGSE